MLARPWSRAFAQAGARPAPKSAQLPTRACAAVQQQWGRRAASSMGRHVTTQFRKSPIAFPFAVGVIVVVSGICVLYIPWYYQNVIIKPYHKFPEEVARKLRRAVFYSREPHLDMREANKYFRQALATADDMGIDPFSDEIMGIKYAIGALFEQAGYYSLAVDVLEIMRSDCQRWEDDFSDQHWTNGNRSRVKKNMVQINVKLAELYDTRYVNEPHNGEKRLVEAVDSALRERQRRAQDGVKAGEGPWLTDEEMGATLEALGTHYEQFDSHYLATPLFVKALELCPATSCHRVVLMNNISSCLSQQSPPSAAAIALSTEPSDFPITNKAPRTVLIEQARQWATKALACSATMQPPNRSEECDVGCAVATHNLGEFFEMEGKVRDAKAKYEEAASLAKAMGFTEGFANAKEGLKRLRELEKRSKDGA